MKTKYPIILAHGILYDSFGKIDKVLREVGYTVYLAKTDCVGKIETNALQLKAQIEDIIKKENCEKVNIIAHSKGGLDTRFMMAHYGMDEKVASVTFLCTPHKGSEVATKLYSMPKFFRKPIAFTLNTFYKIRGDKKPNVLAACCQLTSSRLDKLKTPEHYGHVFMQSYSTAMEKPSDDFLMGIPLLVSRRYGDGKSDGLVTEESSKFAEYKGRCIDESYSHTEMVDWGLKKKKKWKVYAFYINLCDDLANRGF